MAQGSNELSTLGEGRSKLLLLLVPPGPGAAAEVQKRLTLWEERRFEELLQRAEEHLLLSRRPGKKKHDGLADIRYCHWRKKSDRQGLSFTLSWHL